MSHLCRTRRQFLSAGGAALLLAGCGFQLRGARPLPFNTVQITGLSEYSELAVMLKRQIQGNGNTRVVTNPKEADVQLKFLKDQRRKDILSLTGAGKVREYELRENLSITLIDRSGKELLPPTDIAATREMTYDDNQVLAKEQEETVLYRDMLGDLVQQIMRRLAAIKRETGS